jgi:hypothetical protein
LKLKRNELLSSFAFNVNVCRYIKVKAGPTAEIAVLKKLNHANVIKLYTVLDDPAGPPNRCTPRHPGYSPRHPWLSPRHQPHGLVLAMSSTS